VILKRRFLFSVLFVLSIGLMAFSEGRSKARVVDIIAKRYAYVPDEITLKKGEPVILRVRSADVTHGLSIEQFNVKGDVPKNKTASYSFTPERAGDFEGKCSHFCGSGHGSMKMTIHVTE
jgi:cytochrome c oxidase subunit II